MSLLIGTVKVDVFGAVASDKDADVFFDHCLKVIQQIYTSLQLHSKYVRLDYLFNNLNVSAYSYSLSLLL